MRRHTIGGDVADVTGCCVYVLVVAAVGATVAVVSTNLMQRSFRKRTAPTHLRNTSSQSSSALLVVGEQNDDHVRDGASHSRACGDVRAAVDFSLVGVV